MKDEKHLVIYFNNGTYMEVSFPTQIKNSIAAVMEGIQRILESDKLVIQTEQQVIIVPWTSVKYIEAPSMHGATLPFGTIKGACVLPSDERFAK